MLKYMGYLIIESQSDFNEHYDKNWGRLEHCTINKVPGKFPICYALCESWDAHFCDSWVECDVKNAIKEWNKRIEAEVKLINKVEAMFLSESPNGR